MSLIEKITNLQITTAKPMIVEFTISDSRNGDDVTIRSPDNRSMMFVLQAFCARQGHPFYGYKYENSEVENFNSTLKETGIINGSVLTAY